MNRDMLGNHLAALRNARREIIMAHSPELDSEAAPHLLNALLDVELTIIGIEKEQAGEVPRSPVSEMASALAAGRPGGAS